MQNFCLINAKTINKIISFHIEKIYQLVSDAYIWQHQKKIVNSKSHFLYFNEKPDARIIALPAYINHESISTAGLKWISSFPSNHQLNLPRASAIIILNDFKTGYPLACLEGSFISAIRTACSAVLAAEYIFPREKQIYSLGIIGTGFIAKNILHTFITRKWKIDEIILFDKEENRAQRFANDLDTSLFSAIKIGHSAEEVIKLSQQILLTTTAGQPYITDKELLTPDHDLLNISLRDLGPEILYHANNFVDDIDSVLAAKTSPHLTYLQYGNRDFINGSLAELILAEKTFIRNKPTIFSPMGMGFLDLIIADFVYKQVMLDHESLPITDFFT